MIIDFHTHAFADVIAQKAISRLESVCNTKAFSDGTVAGLCTFLEKNNIDKAVILPIATKPTQQTTINNWAKDIMSQNDRLICFGSIHPDAPDVMDEISRIKSLGLKGIKLHPDYQDFFIDDDKMYPIYEKCAELNLPVIFHAGFDPLSPDLIHATPQRSAKAFAKVPQMTMILAHFGGMECFDDVEQYLAGLKGNLYFDTAFISGRISKEQTERIIKKHGSDRILLGSDFPWHETMSELDFIKSLDLPDEDKNAIIYKNAQRLLNL